MSSKNVSTILLQIGKLMKKIGKLNFVLYGMMVVIIPLFLSVFFVQELGEFGYFVVFFILISIGIFIIGILLLVFQIQLLIQLNDLKEHSQDDTLEKILYFQIGVIIANATGFWIVSYILNILTFTELEEWIHSLTQVNNSPPLTKLEESINLIKIGHILSIIFIGVIIVPWGYLKAGEQLILEHRKTHFDWIQTFPQGKPLRLDRTPPSARRDEFTQQSRVQKPSSYKTPDIHKKEKARKKSKKYCPACGAPVKDSQAKYCEVCGSDLSNF